MPARLGLQHGSVTHARCSWGFPLLSPNSPENPRQPAIFRQIMIRKAPVYTWPPSHNARYAVRMHPQSPRPTTRLLQRIRAAATAATERSSLREAARDVGMSPTGLRNFLDGATPYARTFVKLRSWYLRKGSRREEISAGDARASIALLTE